ncbi:hypothetical protein BJ508DRAFT_333060 [Ascobolus immersus RN42]|uniref:Uncharacterized protein n=1 Tax=Ascobolus immersus RN42 TaxID=1160509 RepID=A0A3N4HKN4_ASCIM|nr:hypothetical protein BJ508DRAFT_333060 [Ascobolus immersus RN42]
MTPILTAMGMSITGTGTDTRMLPSVRPPRGTESSGYGMSPKLSSKVQDQHYGWKPRVFAHQQRNFPEDPDELPPAYSATPTQNPVKGKAMKQAYEDWKDFQRDVKTEYAKLWRQDFPDTMPTKNGFIKLLSERRQKDIACLKNLPAAHSKNMPDEYRQALPSYFGFVREFWSRDAGYGTGALRVSQNGRNSGGCDDMEHANKVHKLVQAEVGAFHDEFDDIQEEVREKGWTQQLDPEGDWRKAKKGVLRGFGGFFSKNLRVDKDC